MALLVAGFAVAWLAAMAVGGSYNPRFLAAGPQEYRHVVNAAVWLGATMAIASFLLRLELSRGFVAVTIPAALLLTLIGRCTVRRLLRRHLATGHAIHRVAVVGTSVSGDRLARHLRQNSFAGYEVVGTLGRIPDVHADDKTVQQRQARALLRDLISDARRMGADTIAVTSVEALGHAGIRRLSWELEGTGIRLVVAPNVADVAGPRIVVRPVAGLPLLHIDEPSFGGAQRVVKACIDRVGAALLLVLVSPVMAAIAITALIEQGRPILYRQERIGQNGRVFTMHKFRSMRNGAINEMEALAHLNQHAGEMFKIRQDPRITPLGALLRRYSLDELPQLMGCGHRLDVAGRSATAARGRRLSCTSIDAHRRLLVKPGDHRPLAGERTLRPHLGRDRAARPRTTWRTGRWPSTSPCSGRPSSR